MKTARNKDRNREVRERLMSGVRRAQSRTAMETMPPLPFITKSAVALPCPCANPNCTTSVLGFEHVDGLQIHIPMSPFALRQLQRILNNIAEDLKLPSLDEMLADEEKNA